MNHAIATGTFSPHPTTPRADSAVRNILVIEDERDIADLIALHLSELPANVTIAHDGLGGLDLAMQRQWDAIVLDIRLPGLNGLDLCRELRSKLSPVPILMLTARSGELDRVLGLELGADDYLTKPFSVIELQARVKALLRRSAITTAARNDANSQKPTTLVQGHLKVDRLQRRAWLGQTEITLAPREFDLLWHFMQQPGRVFTRSELLDEVWGLSHDGYDHTVNSHINRLRSKLGDERTDAGFIHTVWGVGYRFEAPA
ncbi:response regulator transcription factor [Hydrogenophaga luteola]|uniref:Response regulator transcription factor n=1 Tax=Hydrogenophaga luteola TaxID=1591122 RepID=A0ABV7W2B8_9BURK